MTSKEALEELLFYATLDDSAFEPTMKDYASVIKDDLEVLKILRKHIYFKQIEGMGTEMLTDIELTILNEDDDYNKIKEWLENGR